MDRMMKQVWVIDDVETGAFARQVRKDHGVSLREVSRRMGVSAAFLSDCERGHRRFSQERYNEFFQALHHKPNAGLTETPSGGGKETALRSLVPDEHGAKAAASAVFGPTHCSPAQPANNELDLRATLRSPPAAAANKPLTGVD